MYFADHKAAVPADSAALPHLKRLRTGRDLTQEQLAEKINVSRTYIVKIENGVQIDPMSPWIFSCLEKKTIVWTESGV